MDSRAPSGPRPRFGCDGSWLMASFEKISSRNFRLCLLKPSSTRRRTVDLFWSVVIWPPIHFAVSGSQRAWWAPRRHGGSGGALGPEEHAESRLDPREHNGPIVIFRNVARHPRARKGRNYGRGVARARD